jgi:hypothetical protein
LARRRDFQKRLIRTQACPIDGIDAILAQYESARRSEKQAAECFIQYIEPTCIGAECRDYETILITYETVSPDRAAAPGDAGGRVKMAGNLAIRWTVHGFVAKNQATDCGGFQIVAGDAGGCCRIVISSNPDPVSAALQMRKRFLIMGAQTVGAIDIMKGIAEGQHTSWFEPLDQASEPGQCLGGIVWRNKLAAPRERRAFLEVKIGNDQQPFIAPPQRAFGQRFQGNTGNFD